MPQPTASTASFDLNPELKRWTMLAQDFQRLAMQILRVTTYQGTPIRRLGVTSLDRQAGTTSVAMQLAAAISNSGNHSVILVDANRKYSWFDREFPGNGPGFLSALSGDVEIADCIHSTTISGLSVVTLGKPVWANVDYGEQSLSDVFEGLSEHADLVIVDLPVIDNSDHNLAIFPHLDGVLLVLTPRLAQLKFADPIKHLFKQLKVELLGILPNQWKS